MDPIAANRAAQNGVTSSAAAGASSAANAAGGASNPASAAAGAGTDSAAGTEDRFLKLLVAQMRNQDPLNPLDNAQVTSQLAQINTVRGIEQLNASMATLASASTAVSPVSAVGLLGRQVLVAGTDFEWQGAAPVAANPDPSMPALPSLSRSARVGFELPSAAASVRVEIVDPAGKVVHAQELSDAEAGVHTLEWDGRDPDGKTARDGKYRLRVFGAGYDGAELRVDALVPARVSGVAQAPDGARVELGGRPAQPASAIRAIL